MTVKQKFWCIVPAAGKGMRMGSDLPKQYLSIEGKTILEHSVERLASHSLIEKVVVVIDKDDLIWPQLLLVGHPKVIATRGGEERFYSVLNGLNMLENLADEEDWILVHDAARPCVRLSDISLLIESLSSANESGGLLACPITDTVKKTNEDGVVEKTLDRNSLWRAMTPQMFKFGQLKKAINCAVEKKELITDESFAMELAGYKPRLVQGASDNIKITTRKDLSLARIIMRNQYENNV